MSFWKDKNVTITGGGGFVGRCLVDLLKMRGARVFMPRSIDYDLRRELGIRAMLDANRADMIIHLAAVAGGIGLNRAHPYVLCYENLIMGAQLIDHAIRRGIPKFVCIGTVCSYPKFTPVPFREENLWDGYPEETNAPYGLAKKMLLVLLQAAREEFNYNGIFIMPSNLFGPGDHFEPEVSHVIPALIRKFVEAKERGVSEATLWGTGEPARDFLYVGDVAEGIMLAAEKYDRPEPINLGTGNQVAIHVVAHLIQDIVGYKGKIKLDLTKPDGQPRRAVSPARAKRILGWESSTPLREGLERTIEWYLKTR